MKKQLRMKFMLLLFALVAGMSNVVATEVTYTVSSKTAVTTSGTAPTNSSVTFSSDGNTAQQLTGGTGQTLTLSGYKGYKITKITLSMRSNTSKGAGTLCYSTNAGSSYTYLVGSSGSGVNFSNSAWHGSWSTDYVNINKTVSIECGESNVIIKIDATANSLYCQSYTLTYETNDDRTPTTITINASEINNNMFGNNTDGGVISAAIKAGETTVEGSVSWSSTVSSVATINASSGAITLAGVGTTTITASFEGNEDYKPSTGTYNLTVINVNPNKTTIWSEDFSGYAADDKPSGGIYNYSCENGGTTTKVFEEKLAGGSSPEILISKSGGSFTATVPLGYCCSGDLTLTFRTNNTNIAVSSSTTGVSISGTIASGANTITISDVTTEMENLVIIFSNSNSSNVRLDDIVLKSLVEIPVSGSNEITNNVTIPYGATSNVSSTVIIPSNKTLTINGILNVTGTLTNNGTAANLIIEDGGQLITNNAVAATAKKNIEAYTVSLNEGELLTNGWYFIASPITDGYTPTGSMVENIYDLYLLNPATTGWENYKNTTGHPNFTTLNNGAGYLYANEQDVTLSFTGTIKPYTTESDAHMMDIASGYNLIGNPYTFAAYIDKPYYSLNNERAIIVPTEIKNEPINPCTGVIVDGGENGVTVGFYKESQSIQTVNNGNIQMTLAQTITTRGNSNVETLDKAIVSFNEGSELPKFYFGTQNANIYIPMDNEEFAIVSSNGQGEMPVNFRAYVAGEYTITVNPEEVEMGYLHLIDNIAGKDVDLLANPSYSFNARTDDYESRFRLVFSTTMVNAEMGEDFAFFSNGQLVIANEGEATLQVIDVTGRVVATESINGTCSKAVNAKAGVYVLRLINGTDVKTQKMVIR